MSRLVISAVVLSLFVSCTQKSETPGASETPSGQAVPATGDPAAADLAKTAGTVPPSAAELPDLDKAIDSGFSLDSLKQSLITMPPERIQELGGKLVAAIQHEEGVIKGLQEQISSLGLADVGKAGELKSQLSSAMDNLKVLKTKLIAVVDKLKESGIDVSKYTAFLQ